MGNTYNYGGSWLLVQCALLVVHYGFNKVLPWWLLWLPSLLLGSIIVVTVIILLIIILVKVIID